MNDSRRIKTWAWVHKWSSLVCTVFMLLLCITGLPLIFHHEIGHLLGTEVEAPKMPAGTPRASLDRVIATAHALHPERVVQFVSQPEDDDGLWFVTLTPTPAPTDDFKSVAVDARTGQVLAQPKFDEGFMWVMFKLHVDLFAGLPGKLFLGFMGLLLLVAIVSRRGALRALHAQAGLRHRAARAPAAPQVAGPAQPAGHRDAWCGPSRWAPPA